MRTAECLVHGDVLGCVLNDNAVLNVLAYNSLEDAVLGRELSDDGEGLLGVNLEAWAVEVLGSTVAVWVVAATILVAETIESTFVTGAAEEAVFAAGVGSDLVGAAVGFPDVHFVAADALAFDVALCIM